MSMIVDYRGTAMVRLSLRVLLLLFITCCGMKVRKSSSDIKGSGDNVCLKPKCLKMAKEIKENMDESVDACDNFYQYACGGWIKKNPIPTGKDEYSSIVQLSDRNDKNIKKLLTRHSSSDTATILKVKNFYRSCLNVKKINERGIKPLQKFIKDLGSWAVSPSWKEELWDFNKTLRKLHREYPAEIFFTVDVDVDPKNRSRNIITIDQAKLSLPQITYYVNGEALDTLKKYAAKVAALAEGTTVNKMIEDQMNTTIMFERELSKYCTPKQSKRYARTSIKRLEEAIPEFPWLEHIREVLKPRKVEKNDNIVVLSNDYLADLVSLLRRTPNRILSCYMMWRMVKDMVPFLSEEFTQAYKEFRDTLTGKTSKKSREETCFRYTDEILGPLVGSLFIRHEFSKNDKEEVEEMMHLIIKAFEENAEDVSWISNQTLRSVKEKADAAVIKVGYPEYLRNETMFKRRYQEIEINPDTFFENVISIDKFSNMRTFRKLDKPVDPHQWVSVPHMANAFYVVTKNEIVIPAGILQRPFFYGFPAPRSVSYGAIGHVLGHELTHGFDTLGRRFNKFGELIQKRTRWSDPSIKIFEDRAKCLVRQFNKYKIGDKLNIDGQNTLGENIADGGGLKIAYKAYKSWVTKNGEEYTLPLLNKSNEQLFFIGYAQKECHNSTHQALVEAIKDDVHAPSMFRIIGTLSNSKDFAKAFNCKLDSAMNPKEKCEVW